MSFLPLWVGRQVQCYLMLQHSVRGTHNLSQVVIPMSFLPLQQCDQIGRLLDFGQLLKPLATINLPKSPTFPHQNFCISVKIYHFCATFKDTWRFFPGHTTLLVDRQVQLLHLATFCQGHSQLVDSFLPLQIGTKLKRQNFVVSTIFTFLFSNICSCHDIRKGLIPNLLRKSCKHPV